MEINILPEAIREVGLEEIAISAKWFSRKWPEAYFGEIDNEKIVFTAGWRIDSRILNDGIHLISRTAMDVFFTKVKEYKRFIVHNEKEGKTEYKNDLAGISPGIIVIPVRKVFSLMEEKVLKAIKSKRQGSLRSH